MRKPLTCEAYIILGDDVIPWNDLKPEQKEAIKENMSRRLSKTMSEYYSNHPDEYAKL